MKDKNDLQPNNINRRNFVKTAATLGAGATALAATGIATASSDRKNACKVAGCDYDVIVIGGGNAGAAASRDCMDNGYKTLLLEARNRLGGRTFSTEVGGIHVEFGGTWVHHTQPFVWSEIERYGLEIKETPGAIPDVMYQVLESGQRLTLTEAQTIEAFAGWNKYIGDARSIIPRPYDILYNKKAALKAQSVSSLDHLNTLKLTPLQRAFNLGMIETMCHSTADQLSHIEILRLHLLGGGYLPTYMDAVIRFQIKEGTGALVNAMVEDGGAEVRMSTPVKSVEDLGDKVVVTTARGEKLTCATVINCLPMNTITNIDFTPALPAGVVAAAKERHPGAGNKLYIKVHGDVGNISSVAPGSPLNFVMTYKQGKDYTILLALGSQSDLLDVYDDESVQQALRTHLPEASVLNTLSYDWNNDPYSQGTWATYRPGWLEKHYADFQKEYGRLFFASGDHGEGWRSTIDGAIGAGIKAAHKVKQLLG